LPDANTLAYFAGAKKKRFLAPTPDDVDEGGAEDRRKDALGNVNRVLDERTILVTCRFIN
jgi:hypothetical protein